MAVILLTFGAVFLLIASLGMLLFYREAMIQRITEVINPQPKTKTLLGTLQQTGVSISEVVVQFQNVLPKSQAEVSIVQQRLIRAGYRKDSAIKVFYGCKVLVPLFLCLLALVTGLGNLSPFFVYVLCLGLGYLAPDFWLGRMISQRQSKIRRGLPDVLDLLIICIEAGLSLDQATARTAEELRMASRSCAMSWALWCWNSAPAGLAPTHGGTWRSAPMWTRCATLFPCWCNRSSLEPASPRLCAFILTLSEPSACRLWKRRRPRPPSS